LVRVCIGQSQDGGAQRNDEQQRQDERIRRPARKLAVDSVEGDRKKGRSGKVQHPPDIEQRDVRCPESEGRAGDHDAHQEHQEADDVLR
jgi:hypothetical protein